MHRQVARTAALTVLAVLASLLTLVSPAQAAESIPELQWPAVNAYAMQYQQMVTSPKGDLTIGCDWLPSSKQDLTTYSATGAVTRQISQTNQIDGKSNCITQPVADKNGDIYGMRSPQVSGGTAVLLAYSGNTLKWKYTTGDNVRPAIGTNGNIYFTVGGSRLIGLAPNLAAGQTQPTKVLDVSCICRGEISAFKEGLAFRSGSSFVFYKYDGTGLGSFDAGGYTPPNAVGRVFYTTKVAGTTASVKVSAFDPLTKQVAWTKQVSTPGADADFADPLTPLPGGGVIATVKQQMMVSDSVPVTPVDYDSTLVALGSNGQQIWSKKLPMTGWYTRTPEGYSVRGIYTVADTTGKVVLIQVWSDSKVGSTSWGRFITVDILDAATGNNLVPTKTLSGNADAASGPKTGYQYTSAEWIPTIGPNTVYISATKCLNSDSSCYTGDGNLKVFPIKVPGLGMDYPRGAVLSGAVPVPYVAMGDSYSSGEGVPPFGHFRWQPVSPERRGIFEVSVSVHQPRSLARCGKLHGVFGSKNRAHHDHDL